MPSYEPFSGAKIALIEGDRLLVYLRDNKPTIPFPNRLDFAGGGRENDETPEQCALRETREEFGLTLDPARIIWRRKYPSFTNVAEQACFLVANLTKDEVSSIRFGDEGQYWQMMEIDAFLSHPKAIPQLQDRLSDFLSGQS